MKKISEALKKLATLARASAYIRAREIFFVVASDKSGLMNSIRAIALALALFAVAVPVRADLNPANDISDIQVTISPFIDRGVVIDTANVNLDMGVLEMGASTQTVRPATVTILGTVTNTELNLSAQITGGWLFDNDPSTFETDNLAVWALFKSTNTSVPPSQSGSDFDNAQDALNSGAASFGPVRVGFSGGNGGLNDRFEDGSVDMDSMVPGTKRHMWFYLRTPQYTSTANTQQIRFTLTVTPGP